MSHAFSSQIRSNDSKENSELVTIMILATVLATFVNEWMDIEIDRLAGLPVAVLSFTS
jgi:hypothetical protein